MPTTKGKTYINPSRPIAIKDLQRADAEYNRLRHLYQRQYNAYYSPGLVRPPNLDNANKLRRLNVTYNKMLAAKKQRDDAMRRVKERARMMKEAEREAMREVVESIIEDAKYGVELGLEN